MRWIVWAQRKGGEEWFRKRELSPEQAFVLAYLLRNPGAIQRDIAQVSRTSAASVSSLLKGMERRSLIERRTGGEGDDRSKRVHLTEAARELIDGIDAAMTGVEEGILAPLDEAERASLHTLLAKITANLSQPTIDGAWTEIPTVPQPVEPVDR
ncbi:MarR family transcriptional regulator (plasmid) [Streptomyces sp. NBC_00111]|uniref:MarR family winged helix-turn-helix transcriptional regulator n=1 Tax=unclassified Streptomyces TaxID=2593676 RepID=UPI002E30EC3E|nr:MarR family transcriptional regulator [Streptomyces sp. NBC_01460]